MPLPIFSAFPTIFPASIPSIPSPSPPWSPSWSLLEVYPYEYLAAVFILLLFIVYIYLVIIFNKRADRSDKEELLETVETEAPVFSYSEDGGDKECVICLCQIEKEEKCRRMNTCNHVFHKDCIDQWFMVEHHCPLCRTVICVVVDSDGNTVDSSPILPFDRNYYNFLGSVW
ncbi:RING-H2 finger protein ATL40-like [Benincasa hispida]|uniref:RING-H2 finger protein ATL40-like n=1 Tax=Benincasa hispida TaxID=102211 RepID=UPI0019012C59|nr:RING-H2 finger protein ATL40-like [Benincasa hispida]